MKDVMAFGNVSGVFLAAVALAFILLAIILGGTADFPFAAELPTFW